MQPRFVPVNLGRLSCYNRCIGDGEMTVRLVWAVISSLLEQAVLVALLLWGLPLLGVRVPIPVIIGLAVALGVYNVLAYQMGSRALKKKPVSGLPDMVGTRGRVVKPLSPRGLVLIRGELWEAVSVNGSIIGIGEEVSVVTQQGLKLSVCRHGEEGK